MSNIYPVLTFLRLRKSKPINLRVARKQALEAHLLSVESNISGWLEDPFVPAVHFLLKPMEVDDEWVPMKPKDLDHFKKWDLVLMAGTKEMIRVDFVGERGMVVKRRWGAQRRRIRSRAGDEMLTFGAEIHTWNPGI